MGTQAQESGHKTLHSLCEDMVDAFKTMDDEVLMAFCESLAVDPSTVEYMNEYTLCYRGIPCEVDQPGNEKEVLANRFYQPLLRVRNDLASRGLLKGLKPMKKADYKYEVMFIIQYLHSSGTPVSQQEYSQDSENYEMMCAQRDSINTNGQFKDKKARAFVLKGTEVPLQMTSGKQTIYYSLGELIFVNEQWCLFTRPNVDIQLVN